MTENQKPDASATASGDSPSFQLTFQTQTLADGRIFGAAGCVVTIGGTAVDAVAVVLQAEKHVSTRQAIIEWLEARGIHDAAHLLDRALEASNRRQMRTVWLAFEQPALAALAGLDGGLK